MHKWKDFFLRLPIYLLLIAVVGVGLWNFYRQYGLPGGDEEIVPTQPPADEQGVPPEELVENIIGIGDVFSVYPDFSTGHLECKILAASRVTQAADCPQAWVNDVLLYVWGENGDYYGYEEWFVPGGALEQGAQLIRLDVEITNVDAVANVQETPTFDPANCDAWYREDNLFDSGNLFFVTDLAEMDVHGNSPWFHGEIFSQLGIYATEDDMGTVGNERLALQLSKGETKKISFVFPVSTKMNGTARNVGYLFGLVQGETIDAPFTYIDLNLEEVP